MAGPSTHLRRRGFRLIVYVFAAGMLLGTIPIPLYVIWQADWGFSATTLTAAFSAFAVGTMTALILAGRLSDRLGRRRVLLPALALAALSTLVFLAADGIGWVFAARMLSGIALGVLAGTAAAALADLEPSGDRSRAARVATAANLGGLGLGPLLAGVLAEYAPGPTVLVFVVYVALLLPAAVAVTMTPETVTSREARSLRLQLPTIPPHMRSGFTVAALTVFCAFAVLGLFGSLVPSFLASSLREPNHAVAGGMAFLIFAVAAVIQVRLAGVSSRQAMATGLPLLAVGLVLIVLALWLVSLPLFVLGTLIEGLGVGLSFMGSMALTNQLAPATRRAEVLSSYYAAAYAGLTLPSVGTGLASEQLGMLSSAVIFAVAIGLLAAAAAALVFRGSLQPDGWAWRTATLERGRSPG